MLVIVRSPIGEIVLECEVLWELPKLKICMTSSLEPSTTSGISALKLLMQGQHEPSPTTTAIDFEQLNDRICRAL